MKRFVLLFSVFVFALVAFAQNNSIDLIITEAGETIKAYSIEISSRTIFYQTDSSSDSPIQRIPVDDVMVIKYADGKKWIPNQTVNDTQKMSETPTKVSYTDEAANRASAARANPDKVTYIGKEDGKPASEILMLFSPTKESVLADENLEMIVRTHDPGFNKENYRPSNLSIDIVLINRGDNTLYIDLGDTYLINNGESIKYYVPGAVSNSTTTGVGAGIGIGVLSVGGMQSSTQAVTTFAERVLPIPPGVTKVLVSGKFTPFGKIKDTGLDYGNKGLYGDLTLLRSKDKYLYNGTSTSDFDGVQIPGVTAIVTYALDEAITAPVKLKATYEPSKMIGAKIGKCVDQAVIRTNDFSSNCSDFLFLVFKQDKKK